LATPLFFESRHADRREARDLGGRHHDDADKIVNETSGSTSGTRTYTRDYNLLQVKTGEKVTFTAKPFWALCGFHSRLAKVGRLL